ncbi:hypothetical protein PG5_03140 [Pseudomonas sp. G5(2012)]|nr:hypothetical protein PG5_03140 [Pseudomonas sp. G5(2012)]
MEWVSYLDTLAQRACMTAVIDARDKLDVTIAAGSHGDLLAPVITRN